MNKDTSKKIIVMKFGGTSVGDAACITRVAHIITEAQKKDHIVVVVSAMGGVTNLLVNAAQYAASKKQSLLDKNVEQLRQLYKETVEGLQLPKQEEEELVLLVDNHIFHLESLLYSIYELGDLTTRVMDVIASFGERLSVHFISAAIRNLGYKAKPLESSSLIVTDNNFGNAQPLLTVSAKKMQPIIKELLDDNTIPVITGFLGATKKGVITTLGRGGTDFSATIIGYGMDADEVWIWTDVDGVMTADPKIVESARTIPELSYNEAAELSYFGAKVLHPLTIVPAEIKHFPVWIKNTFNPMGTGTQISDIVSKDDSCVKAISSMSDLSLVTIEGKGMIGVPGTAAKMFGAIATKNINVLFISQASSEHNISFVVKKSEGAQTVSVLKEAFRTELLNRRIDAIPIEKNVAIIAIVGVGMKGYPGVAGKTFSALGSDNINVRAIAQGSSELNISFVVQGKDVKTSVRSVHQAFGLNK